MKFIIHLMFALIFMQYVNGQSFKDAFGEKVLNSDSIKIKGRFGLYTNFVGTGTNSTIDITIDEKEKVDAICSLLASTAWKELHEKPDIQASSIAIVVKFMRGPQLVDECRLASGTLYYNKKWYADESSLYENALLKILVQK